MANVVTPPDYTLGDTGSDNPYASSGTSTSSGGSSGDTFNLGNLAGQSVRTNFTDALSPTEQSTGSIQLGRIPFQQRPGGSGILAESTDATSFMQQMASLAATDPAQLAQYQLQMWQSGLFGSGKKLSDITLGKWTPDTAAAFKKLVSSYTQADSLGGLSTQQKSVFNYLDDLSANPVGEAATQQQKPTTVNQYTDANSIVASAQSAAQAALGRNLTDDQVKAFVNEFHASQVQYNAAANKAQQDTSGGTFNLTQPDASADAQAYINQNFGTEQGAKRMSDYVLALEQMLGVS
jgi:hypothetical protein